MAVDLSAASVAHFSSRLREPQACLYGRGGTVAARVLRQLVLDGIGDEESTAAPAGPHMRLALYDLLGALFAPSDPGPVSRHADRLFSRIRGLIKDRCADPDFGPAEVAAETGISLRHVQKILMARGSTCMLPRPAQRRRRRIRASCAALPTEKGAIGWAAGARRLDTEDFHGFLQCSCAGLLRRLRIVDRAVTARLTP